MNVLFSLFSRSFSVAGLGWAEHSVVLLWWRFAAAATATLQITVDRCRCYCCSSPAPLSSVGEQQNPWDVEADAGGGTACFNFGGKGLGIEARSLTNFIAVRQKRTCWHSPPCFYIAWWS